MGCTCNPVSDPKPYNVMATLKAKRTKADEVVDNPEVLVEQRLVFARTRTAAHNIATGLAAIALTEQGGQLHGVTDANRIGEVFGRVDIFVEGGQRGASVCGAGNDYVDPSDL